MEWILVALFQGVDLKQPCRDAEHTIPLKAKAKNEWSCTSTFQNILMFFTQNTAFHSPKFFLTRRAKI
jgi:hypothetical protein